MKLPHVVQEMAATRKLENIGLIEGELTVTLTLPLHLIHLIHTLFVTPCA